MKRTGLIITGALLIAAAGSCSKTHNCHCTYKTDGNLTHEENKTIDERNKDRATEKCNELDATNHYTIGGTTYTETIECSLTD